MSSATPPKHAGRFRRTLLVVAATLSFLMAAGSAAAFGGYWWVAKKIEAGGRHIGSDTETGGTTPSRGSASPSPFSLGGKCKDTCNYLVLGSDSRSSLSAKEQRGFQSDAQIGGYRSDTIILVHINGQTRHATIVSFPRDLLVDIPGYGQNKINAAFNLGAADGRGITGAMALSAKTVSELTGMEINHILVVDLGGFQSIVKEVGGVPFCTPIPLADDPQAYPNPVPGDNGSGLNLPHSGCYTLDGPTALALVRARSVVSNGKLVDCVSDYSRISRQQQFMRGLLNKLLSPQVLPKVPGLVDVVVKQLSYDDHLDVPQLVDLTNAMRGLASGNADFRIIPNTPDKDWNLLVNAQGREFLRRLRNDEPLGDLGTNVTGQPPSPTNIAVRVYDDSSEGHAQLDVYDAQLSQAGFKLMDTQAESAPTNLQGMGTTILYNKGYEEQAKVVANYVPGGYPIRQAKPGELPEDTQVGVVVDVNYKYHDVGEGKAPSIAVNCPYH